MTESKPQDVNMAHYDVVKLPESKPLKVDNDMSEDDIIELLEEMEIKADTDAGVEDREDEGPAVEIRPRTPRPYASGMSDGRDLQGGGLSKP